MTYQAWRGNTLCCRVRFGLGWIVFVLSGPTCMLVEGAGRCAGSATDSYPRWRERLLVFGPELRELKADAQYPARHNQWRAGLLLACRSD